MIDSSTSKVAIVKVVMCAINLFYHLRRRLQMHEDTLELSAAHRKPKTHTKVNLGIHIIHAGKSIHFVHLKCLIHAE